MKWIALALALFSSLAISDIDRSYIKDATVATLVKDGWNVMAYDLEFSKLDGYEPKPVAIYILQRDGQIAECATSATRDHRCFKLGK